MIENPVAQAHAVGKPATLVQIFVDCIAPGEHDARDLHLIAHFQRSNFFFGEGKAQLRHGGISIQARPNVHHALRGQFASDLSPLGFGELGQLFDDFGSAHSGNLPWLIGAGKRCGYTRNEQHVRG